MSADGWWERVCATVTRLGEPRTAHRSPAAPAAPMPPPERIDLHGLTMDQAHRCVYDYLTQCHSSKWVTVITGKSGNIRREFPFWMDQMGFQCEDLNGSFRVRVRKQP